MLHRLRRFLDVRPGEGLPVLLTFLYIAVVVAAFLLAKPIRNGLFLADYGPYALVYVYAAVPLVLTLFVPAYTRVAARFGARTVTVGTLVFFSVNVLLFWYAFRYRPFFLLPGVFYVWVNCFGIIAPVQAWSFANSLFDTRQAKRLFGLIGAGASLGAVSGGLLARLLVGPVGGAVNMMLVLAALILLAAAIVFYANVGIRRRGLARRGRPASVPLTATLRQIAGSRYLRLIAGMVFLVAVVTQWTAFQLSLVANARFGGNADDLTAFFGTFNFTLGAVSFLVQLLLTGTALRRYGLAVTIVLLPIALGAGSTAILMVPVFWAVLVTNAFDQGLRFSLDKATYELLYLPIPPGERTPLKHTIDIIFNRVADAAGGVLLGVATQGFFMLPGFGVGLRGTAAMNLLFIATWIAIAWRLRGEYVRTIHESIHRHRIDTERAAAGVLDRTAAEALQASLGSADPAVVSQALDVLQAQHPEGFRDGLTPLLAHEDSAIRRRAMKLLGDRPDEDVAGMARGLLQDADLGVRTEALVFLAQHHGIDPLQQIQELGEFEDFSIRASMAAFLASPGPTQNLDAARALLETMAASAGEAGARDRAEAARLVGLVPEAFADLLPVLLGDRDAEVARQAVGSAAAAGLVDDLIPLLAREDLAEDAARALAVIGDPALRPLAHLLRDESASVAIRREIPGVLLRIGTVEARQVLVESLLQADATVRYRVVASLNKLRARHPELNIDPQVVELLLAAEIAGHYRSYQVLGPLLGQLRPDDPVLQRLRQSMDQELERIFRLLGLLFPQGDLHDAYVGARSNNPIIRANALEFLDNVLKPELRHVLVPLLDSQVSVEERIAMADRLVGAPLETAEQAIATLLASEDVWLRSTAVQAVGALQLRGLEGELRRFEETGDPRLAEAVRAARQRLERLAEPAEGTQEPAPGEMGMGVG